MRDIIEKLRLRYEHPSREGEVRRALELKENTDMHCGEGEDQAYENDPRKQGIVQHTSNYRARKSRLAKVP